MSDIQFNVTVNDPYNFGVESIVLDAVSKWDSVIVTRPSYIQSMNLVMDISDLGPGILGAATPDYTYGDNNNNSILESWESLTVTGGTIMFNQSFVENMRDTIRSDGKSTLYYVVLHEIGHILGIGVWWDHFQFVVSYTDGNGVTKSYYNGNHALREYRHYMQDTSGVLVGVPIEDNGGAGTAGAHPEEGFQNGVSVDNRYINTHFHGGLDLELMTGWLDDGTVVLPMSGISLGFLEDLGFTVDYSNADLFLGLAPDGGSGGGEGGGGGGGGGGSGGDSGGGGGGGGGGSGDFVCFLEGSTILCLNEETGEDCYKPIECLRPGTLVKTYKHDYVAIDKIGFRRIQNCGLAESDHRLKNRLYVCRGMGGVEDLVVTGCHSLLVDDLSSLESDIMRLECGGQLLQTDDKYRLMAFVSDHCSIYDFDGEAVIWHLALCHEDRLMNYGVYANGGWLVESCSLRMLEDYADMTFV